MTLKTVADFRKMNGSDIAAMLIHMADIKDELDEVKRLVNEEDCDGTLYPPQIDGLCPCLYCCLQRLFNQTSD